MTPLTPFPPSSLLVAYLRDSGGNEQDLSLEQQQAVVSAWCRDHDYILHHVYRDSRTASSVVGRTAFEAMLQDLRSLPSPLSPTPLSPSSPPIAGVVIWNWSRFARNIDDAQFHRADLRRRGLEFYSLNDNIPPGAEGRLFEAILDWKNERFLLDLSADVARGLHHLVRLHRCAPGPVPVGYRPDPLVIGVRRDGRPHTASRWVPDPLKAPLVRQAFEMRAAGASIKSIQRATCLYSNSTGYTYMFRNPIYIGLHVYGDDSLPGFTDPLIDQSTWDAVQRRNQAASRLYRPDLQPGSLLRGSASSLHPRRRSSPYLLSGLVYCADCSSLLTGFTCRKGPHTYYYYRCASGHRQLDHPKPVFQCPRKLLEDAVLNILVERILTPENVLPIQEQYLAAAHDRQASSRQRLQEYQAQLTDLDARLDRLASAISDAGHSPTLITQLAQLEKRKSELLIQLAILNTDPLPTLDDTRLALEALLRTLAARDPDQLRPILHGIIHRITVHRQNGTDGNVQPGCHCRSPSVARSPSITGEITYLLPPFMRMDQNSSEYLSIHTTSLSFSL